MGMGLQTGSKGAKTLKPNINVTPLVDVVLVLLIIFMVVIPNMQDGKPIEMLKVEEAEEIQADAEPIVVTIDHEEVFSLDNEDMSRQAVIAAIQVTKQAEPRKPVLIRGDNRVPYRAVRDFFGELQNLGIQNISLAVGKGREWTPEDAEGGSPEGAG